MKVIIFFCAVAVAFAFDESVEKTCTDEPDEGMCRGYFPMYYYDKDSGTCKEFIYGGCGGNGNNYGTEEECLDHCSDVGFQAALDRPDCDKDPEIGWCDAIIRRFYYDQKEGMCKKFVYGGCGGNRNNFKSEFECYNKCGALHAQPEACQQEKVVGPCRAAFRRFFFNKETGQCEKFIYGGCGGNDNNFSNEEQCQTVCMS